MSSRSQKKKPRPNTAPRRSRTPGPRRSRGSGSVEQRLGRAIGQEWGKQGGRIGAAAGDAAHAALARVNHAVQRPTIAGQGSWRVRNEALNAAHPRGASIMLSGKVPAFSRGDGEGTVVKFEEFICNVYSSGPFANNLHYINPGIFPWLRSIALNYATYKFRGLAYQFRSASGGVSSGSMSLGTICLSTSYDLNEPAYGSMIEAMNTEYSSHGTPLDSFVHGVEVKATQSTQTMRYVRAIASSVTDRMMDVGRLQVCREGQPTTGDICGQLWATYSVEFYKERLGPQLAAEIPSRFWRASNLTHQANQPSSFGNDMTTDPASTIDCTTSTGGDGLLRLSLPNETGRYLVIYNVATLPNPIYQYADGFGTLTYGPSTSPANVFMYPTQRGFTMYSNHPSTICMLFAVDHIKNDGGYIGDVMSGCIAAPSPDSQVMSFEVVVLKLPIYDQNTSPNPASVLARLGPVSPELTSQVEAIVGRYLMTRNPGIGAAATCATSASSGPAPNTLQSMGDDELRHVMGVLAARASASPERCIRA